MSNVSKSTVRLCVLNCSSKLFGNTNCGMLIFLSFNLVVFLGICRLQHGILNVRYVHSKLNVDTLTLIRNYELQMNDISYSCEPLPNVLLSFSHRKLFLMLSLHTSG